MQTYEKILSGTIVASLMFGLFLILYGTAEEIELEVEAVPVFSMVNQSTVSTDVAPEIYIHHFLEQHGIRDGSEFLNEHLLQVSMEFDQSITYHFIDGGYIIFDYASLEVVDFEL